MKLSVTPEPVREGDATRAGWTLNPFHYVVRRRVRRAFGALSAGDPEPALGLMDDRVVYTFAGDHAVGGTRRSKAAVRRWFERILRLLPGRFTIRSVDVAGWPWSARVVVMFEDEVTPAAGPAYRNRGVQVTELRWGKAVRIQTYVDTALVVHALDRMAAAGVADASAPPIED